MKVNSTRYDVGEKVYVNTKSGMEETVIEHILISIDKSGQSNRYYVTCSDGYESYWEDKIYPTKIAAKKKLTENIDQLQLALPSNQ